MRRGGSSSDSMLCTSSWGGGSVGACTTASTSSGGGGGNGGEGGDGRARVGGGPRDRMAVSIIPGLPAAIVLVLRPAEENEKAVAGMLKLRPLFFSSPPLLRGVGGGGERIGSRGGGSGMTRSGISSGDSCGRGGRAGLAGLGSVGREGPRPGRGRGTGRGTGRAKLDSGVVAVIIGSMALVVRAWP